MTLVVENFFSKMRARNDMPTVLEFAYLFSPTIRETLKQLTDIGFVYIGNRNTVLAAGEDQQPLTWTPLEEILDSVTLARFAPL